MQLCERHRNLWIIQGFVPRWDVSTTPGSRDYDIRNPPFVMGILNHASTMEWDQLFYWRCFQWQIAETSLKRVVLGLGNPPKKLSNKSPCGWKKDIHGEEPQVWGAQFGGHFVDA